MEKDEWKMPGWMEPLRNTILNTGGNPIEELMNDNHNHFETNLPRAVIICCVKSQVNMLEHLNKSGLLHNLAEARTLAKPMGKVIRNLSDDSLIGQIAELNRQIVIKDEFIAELRKDTGIG